MLRIYHNPRCSKSRATLALIEKEGLEPEVVKYLETPPDREELIEIIGKLGISPRELVRRGEREFKALGLDRDDVSNEALLDAMLRNPNLMQRPIVINGDKARIGRPPESVLEIL